MYSDIQCIIKCFKVKSCFVIIVRVRVCVCVCVYVCVCACACAHEQLKKHNADTVEALTNTDKSALSIKNMNIE